MIRFVILLALLAACADETCQKCIDICAPFAVARCDVDWGAGVHRTASCSCDVTRGAP